MRRTTVLRSLCAIGLASLLLSCASGPPVLPDVPERSAIKAAAAGFSPVGDEATRTIDLALTYGNKDAVVSWTVKIATGSVVLKELSGAAPDLPDTVSWDGKNELGQVCPEGEYYALLSVGYGATYNPSPIAWDKFLLVASRPQVELSALPPTLVPSGKGMVEGVIGPLRRRSQIGVLDIGRKL